MDVITKHPKLVQFGILLIAFFLLILFITPNEANVLWRLPSLIASWPGAINNSAEYLMFDAFPVQVYDADLEEFEQSALIREVTRAFSRGVLFLIELIREILIGGVKTIAAFVGYEFIRQNDWAVWPALPWTVVTGGAMILGYALKGRGLAILAGLALTYISVFGQWEPAMETLSFVLVAAPVSVHSGILFGVLAFKSRAVEATLMPLLNIAQTMPHFSYLVPVTVFFGLGDHAGAIATIIFATPPMIRLTLLGLK